MGSRPYFCNSSTTFSAVMSSSFASLRRGFATKVLQHLALNTASLLRPDHVTGIQNRARPSAIARATFGRIYQVAYAENL